MVIICKQIIKYKLESVSVKKNMKKMEDWLIDVYGHFCEQGRLNEPSDLQR